MKIGIIGIGNMGSALSKLWAKKGHRVFLGARDPEKVRALAASIGAGAAGGSVAEATRFGEVVLLAPDFMSLVLGHTTSAGEEVARLAPGAKVVKAFNAVFAGVLDTGPLRNARSLEPLGQLCIQLAYGLGMGTDIAVKLLRR